MRFRGRALGSLGMSGLLIGLFVFENGLTVPLDGQSYVKPLLIVVG